MLQKDTWAGERGNVYQGVDAQYTKMYNTVLSQTIADIFHDHYDRRWCTFFLQENSVVVYEKSDKYQISQKQGQTISTQYHFLMLLFKNDCWKFSEYGRF